MENCVRFYIFENKIIILYMRLLWPLLSTVSQMTWRSSKKYRSQTGIWRICGTYGWIERKTLYSVLYLVLFAFLFLALKLGRKSKIDDFRQSFLRIMKVNWFFLSYFERETAIWRQIHVHHKKLNRLTYTETFLKDVLSITGHWALDLSLIHIWRCRRAI